MKSLLLLPVLFLVACGEIPTTTKTKSGKTGTARVTAYNPFERDRVKVKRGRHYSWKWIRWGRRTSSGVRAKEGTTIAAPKSIPFGTKVFFPQLKGIIGDGRFVVQDRGNGAKIFRTNEWFDVFVNNKQRMDWISRIMPEYLYYQIQ